MCQPVKWIGVDPNDPVSKEFDLSTQSRAEVSFTGASHKAGPDRMIGDLQV